MALDQPNQNSGDATAIRLEVKSVFTANPFAQAREIKDENRIDRLGGISSQPWSEIASRNSGGPSMLTDVQNQESELPLLWIGARPNPCGIPDY
jgi:hypothetical protein